MPSSGLWFINACNADWFSMASFHSNSAEYNETTHKCRVSVKQILHCSISCLASPMGYDDTPKNPKLTLLWFHLVEIQYLLKKCCHQNLKDREQLGHKWFEVYMQFRVIWLLTLMDDETQDKQSTSNYHDPNLKGIHLLKKIVWIHLSLFSVALHGICWGIIS